MLSDVNAFVRSCLVQSFAIERDFAAGVNENCTIIHCLGILG